MKQSNNCVERRDGSSAIYDDIQSDVDSNTYLSEVSDGSSAIYDDIQSDVDSNTYLSEVSNMPLTLPTISSDNGAKKQKMSIKISDNYIPATYEEDHQDAGNNNEEWYNIDYPTEAMQ